MSDHTPRARKSQHRTLGDQPVHIVTFTEDAAEGPAPAHTAEGPVPAPAPTLEIVHE